MSTILSKMAETAQQYVEILREILGLDASIIDSSQIRIAGSGRMKQRIGDMSSYGNIVLSAIQTRKTVVVTNPGENPLCASCIDKEYCDNLAEIWSPIFLQDTLIGVIGCVCYTQEQRQMFLERVDVIEEFFTLFSNLLSSYAYTFSETERHQSISHLLEKVLARAQVGVLILDTQDRIVNVNTFGRDLLGINLAVRDFTTVRLEKTANGKEYLLSLGDHALRIIGDLYVLSLEPFSRLLIFSDAQRQSKAADELLGLKSPRALDRIAGHSKAITELKSQIRMVALSSSNVLITGESGTGKELVARAVHDESPRRDAPFIAVNCAALPETLLESELFGYVKGAFTGASAQGKVGLLESAKGGTFFFDEIGDMPLLLQAKLLRVLEQREIMRVGGNMPIPIDVRFVFATNCDLMEKVRDGTFRKDLYYRINVIPLKQSPLRERREDIQMLAGLFIRRFSSEMQKPVYKIDDAFWNLLVRYPWPGNVRELQNTMEYVVNMMHADGVLHAELLSRYLTPETGDLPPALDLGSDWSLAHAEERLIRQCLQQYSSQKNGKKLAANQLGIGLATLYRKMKQYQIAE